MPALSQMRTENPNERRRSSLRRLTSFAAPAHNVEEYLLERFAAVAYEQTLRGVVVLDAAALHDDHALAQTLDLAHVVGGQQHRGAALLAKAFEMAAHPVGGIGIERRSRLVEQKDLWRVDERLRERDAGLLSGREFARRPVEKLREIEFPRQRCDAAVQILDRVEAP